MNRLRPPTSTQPQVNDSRIYSVRVLPIVKVKLKGTGRELTINRSDFDPDRHVRLD